MIPGDGEVIEGIASVDESAITGESAPVIRESGGDRSAVTGGTRVLSDRIVVRITVEPGRVVPRPDDQPRGGREAAEDAERDRAHRPPRRHDDHLPDRLRDARPLRASTPACGSRVTVIVALLVCLIPTTIGGLLSAIGIAGMDRLIRHNVIPMSGRAVEAAGDVDTMLLDKTGTITLGNRMATEFVAAPGGRGRGARRRRAAREPRRRDARRPLDRRPRQGALRSAGSRARAPEARFVPFSAQTRMSGCDLDGRSIRKGAVDAVAKHVAGLGGKMPVEVEQVVTGIAKSGGTPLVVSEGAQRARRRPPQGRGEGRHQGALRALPDDGPAHGDDHRRQPAHRGGDRRGGGRRRLPRRGDAGDEARSSSATSRRRASSSP